MFSIAVPIRKKKANAKPASAPIFPLAVLAAIVLPVATVAVADTFILLVVLVGREFAPCTCTLRRCSLQVVVTGTEMRLGASTEIQVTDARKNVRTASTRRWSSPLIGRPSLPRMERTC